MNNFSLAMKTAASLLLVGVLAACSSSNDPAPVAGTPPATTFTVSGTAATGAAFANAAVTILTSDGTSYPNGATVLTDANGAYSITLPLTAKPPFVVQAARDDQKLISVVAQAKDTTTNITPVTNLIASRLSSSGDPSKLAAEIQADPTLVDLAKITAKVAEIVALIQPLRDAVDDSTDPLNGNIQAAVIAGTGADKLLDSLSISITPSSSNTVNIEVSVKQKQAEGEQPVVIAFSGGTGATAPPAALPTVEEADLVPSGTAALIADLLQRITACYALPLADRVTTGGTAANIVATACKDIFVGNDPARFLNNGARVSSTGAWSSIFGTGSGAKFDRGSYEFTRSNDDLVIAFRATDTSGNSSNYILVVRADTDTKLRAIGNQYQYNGGVNAYHQLRTFINQTGADYYSTGYSVSVTDSIDSATGKSKFDRVEVITPKPNKLTLKPRTGYSYLPLMNSTGQTGSSIVRIRSVYVAAENSAKNPADAPQPDLFFSPTPQTDDQIKTIPAQSVWTFNYYLAGNTGATPDATQHYKTRARAMTIPELQTQPLATLTPDLIADLKSNTKVNSSGGLYVPTPAAPDLITLDWVYPTDGPLPPTSIQVWGGANGVSFNDNASVKSSARTGTIGCTASGADMHCTADGHYVPGGISGLHLWANDAAGREFAHFYELKTIVIP